MATKISEAAEKKLEELAIKESVEKRVHFLGYVSKEDKSRIIDSSLFLTVPSRQEAMSIVVLESGICGKPVLITDQCGFNVIEKIDGGKVVQASVKGIELGLIEILRDKDRLNSMGSNLKQYTNENFTWDSIIGKYLTLFGQILM